MKKVKNIFVVLTYINSDDLIDFLDSVSNCVDDYQVIVVNSFHDAESKNKIEQIAKNYNCDFLNVENKGYSYGNNRGIEYALQNYNFQYLTVSNADIIIRSYNTNLLPKEGIFAGILIAKKGHMQNPMIVKENNFSEKLIYEAFVHGTKWKFILGVGLNKIFREIFLFTHAMKKPSANGQGLRLFTISQAHGSFLTFSRDSLFRLWDGADTGFKGIFDENIFLFAEESVLAKRAKALGIPVYYSNFAVCHHKEDGSMKLSHVDIGGELAKANIYAYEHYAVKKH